MSKPRKTAKNRRPRVDELIAARNPMERLAVKPVDLYAVAPTPRAGEAQAPPIPETGEKALRDKGGEPATSETPTSRAGSNSTSPATRANAVEPEDVVVPYGTYIRSSQRTGIKLRAAVTGRDAYEIVQAAIDEYFENHPVEF